MEISSLYQPTPQELAYFGITPVRSGKVRDLYRFQDELWLVASDRISAFDCIMPTEIPHKGVILTQLSKFWFEKTQAIVPNHVLGYSVPDSLPLTWWEGRLVRARRTEVIPVECVARGYLAGSGWKEYQQCGTVGGHPMPAGLIESAELPHPIFTPAAKIDAHDENLTPAEAIAKLGQPLYDKLSALTLELYGFAREYARRRGIIIADTKFEFGRVGDEIILIDEALTPDSSRFWPAAEYVAGRSQPSFDKQYLRDYLQGLVDTGLWDKNPPGPSLPEGVVQGTLRKYQEALDLLTQ
ncbi:phosphoribosylaminoimidazolesuccinocarboxamide synthase [Verrucomicrobia bacterium LW23]|nr:phosphoribosylaminoimidazolesuccinocarboxamide synthase [Verrucomicrobia bacterium LW23]